MALQSLNFRNSITKLSFTPGLLAGAITLCCGVTASLLLPASGIRAALVGSTVGAAGVTILRKRQEQNVKQIVETHLESYLGVINGEVITLKNQFQQLQGQVKAPAQIQIAQPQIKPQPVIKAKISSQSSSQSSHADNTQSTNVADLIAWLNTRNVKVESAHEFLPIDDLFDNLAVILGEDYTILEPLHYQIIKSLQTGRKFSFNLANSSQKSVSLCTQFCQNLHNQSLLDSYYYDKKQKVIHAAPQIGKAEITQFLNGGWFERFVYKKVAKLLAAQGLQYQYLRNPQIVFPNGDKFELDLLFLVNNELIWIECKSGQQSSSALKSYCERRRTLAVPKEKAFLVGLKLSDVQTASWTELWDITVTNSNDFLKRIRSAVRCSTDS
ncbi:hypothetical protein NIES2109_34250 [Nostoc sp. HK-01]|nr:hypothetical protein NIES2109_34250 [Nostoc sp. HK-01]